MADLTGSASGAIVQADWTDSERQKWRPFHANQATFFDGTISGFRLLQRSSGMFACVDAPWQFLPIKQAEDQLLSLSQHAALPMPQGLSVFQASTDPIYATYFD
ncbi:hypothetical protein ACWAUC_18900 [Bradyrhizobium guangdongense]